MNKQYDFGEIEKSASEPSHGEVKNFLSDERVHRISVAKSIIFRIREKLSRRSTMDKSRSESLAWNEDTVYGLGLYRFIGSGLGIWPLTCHEYGSKMIFLVVFNLHLSMAYNLIREFLSGCISVHDTVDFIVFLATNCLCLLKMSIIRGHRKNMCHIMECAVRDWSIDRDAASRETMREYAHRGRVFSIFPLSIGLSSTLPMVIYSPPTLGRATGSDFGTSNMSIIEMRNLPMGTGCSVIGLPIFLYLALYLYQCVQIVCLACCNFGCDAVFFGISLHICAQLKLLRNDVEDLGRNPRGRDIKEDVRASIKRHNHLLSLLGLVEDVFHLIILGLLGATGLDIIFLGIQMLIALGDESFMTAAYASSGIICLLLQLYAYCLMGDYLASHVENLRIGAYSCAWYNFPSSFTKDITFVIMKSNNAYRLTAGKILSMNMENFTSVIKTMASFFSVMKLTVLK